MHRSIEQSLFLPSAAPRLIDLALMVQSRRIVIAEHVEWSRKSRVHRLQFRDAQGSFWLHFPATPTDRGRPINTVRLEPRPQQGHTGSTEWSTAWMTALRTAYSGSRYFEEYEIPLMRLLQTDHGPDLLALLTALRHQIFSWLHLEEVIAREESTGQLQQSEWTSWMTQQHWVSEPHSETFFRPPVHRIHVTCVVPYYWQHFQPFIPDCCALDLLFEHGPESWRVIEQMRLEFAL